MIQIQYKIKIWNKVADIRPYTQLLCESRLLCPLQECGDYVYDSP